ncbi:hypothetical protein B0T14DRAFT_512406 [Immersiella caudata]|uniref:Uncharacterized protein n=1 Tax=Immersiella caudata TaxID=314043 RepID=A0AA39X5I2_9PEZI|nr:hypothetical protein B0T14DRAFT_512406 [Immersiella caudata]
MSSSSATPQPTLFPVLPRSHLKNAARQLFLTPRQVPTPLLTGTTLPWTHQTSMTSIDGYAIPVMQWLFEGIAHQLLPRLLGNAYQQVKMQCEMERMDRPAAWFREVADLTVVPLSSEAPGPLGQTELERINHPSDFAVPARYVEEFIAKYEHFMDTNRDVQPVWMPGVTAFEDPLGDMLLFALMKTFVASKVYLELVLAFEEYAQAFLMVFPGPDGAHALHDALGLRWGLAMVPAREAGEFIGSVSVMGLEPQVDWPGV